jgi:hypothetical protein
MGRGLRSRCDDAIAIIHAFEVEEMTVSAPPLTGLEIFLQAAQPFFEISDSRECRYRGPYAFVEIGMGPAPVGTQKAVCAVMRNRHGGHSQGSEYPSELFHGGKQRFVDFPDLWEIVEKPEILNKPDPGEKDDLVFRDTACLDQAPFHVRPVVEAQNGHGDIKGIVPERNGLRPGLHHRRSILGPLGNHQMGRFHGDETSARRFVGTNACTQIYDGGSPAEFRM